MDDEPTIRRIIQTRLEFGGYDVVTAEHGEQALRLAREAHPDLVLLDVLMPGLSGYDVCRQLKRDPETRSILVIFVSVNRSEEVPPEIGADGYIAKPFEGEELLRMVARVLAQAPQP